MKKNLVALFFMLGTHAAFAQMEPLERANKAFEYKDYASAMESYEETLLVDSTNADALRKVSHCYEAMYLLDGAKQALALLVELPTHTPDDALAYGQVLMQKGEYEKAKKQFENYAIVQPELGRYFTKGAENAIKLAKSEPLFTIKNSPLNSDAADFCAAMYSPQQIIFTSTRDPQTQKSKVGTPARLFVATQNSKDDFTNVKLEKHAINDKESEGPAAFNATATTGVFVRNNIKNGIKPLPNMGMKQDLFFGTVKALGIWQEIKAFNGNKTDYSAAYPFLSENGKTLYFASDMAGGQGGFDIYKSDNIGGIWTAPINLGDKINTAGDEITPFVEDNTLSFSSNWLMGLGGFDVFELDMQDDEAVPTHLGTGVNSEGDDFGYVFNSRLNYGFLTSNRKGGKGQEDIYQIAKKQAKIVDIIPKVVEIPQNNAEKAVVAEYKTPTIIPNANRSTKNIGNEIQEKIKQAQQEAEIANTKNNSPESIVVAAVDSTQVAPGGAATNVVETPVPVLETAVSVEKPVVAIKNVLEKTPEPIIEKTPEPAEIAPVVASAVLPQGVSQGFLIDANTKKPIEGAAVKCMNKTDTRIAPQEDITDTNGAYTLNLNPNTLYWIEYNANGYRADYQQFTTNDKLTADLPFMSLKPKNSGLTPLVFGLPAAKNTPAQPARVSEIPASVPDQTVYEIHVTATEQPLTSAQEEELRKHGTLYKVQKEAFFLYKLGWYDNASCAATTCEKIKTLGYPSALATPKKVNPNTGETKLRLKIGSQKASCATERPGTGGKTQQKETANTVSDTLKEAPETTPKSAITAPEQSKEYAIPTKKVESVPLAPQNIVVDATPENIEEGAVLDADPEAAKRADDDGFLYYIQLGSFEPKRKIKFTKIEKLKLGQISKHKANDGRSMYMLGVFNSRDTAYKMRKIVQDTGEVEGPFILKYDKEGNKIQ